MRNILGSPDKQWISPYSQHGDVLIKKVGKFDIFEKEFHSIPKEAINKNGNLVLKGMTNSHALYGGKFQLLESEGITFVKVEEPCFIDHVKDLISDEPAEHHAQWIPVGEYFIDVVFERDHVLEESKAVID